MIRESLATIVDQPQLDVCASDVDTDKQRELRLGECDDKLGAGHGCAVINTGRDGKKPNSSV